MNTDLPYLLSNKISLFSAIAVELYLVGLKTNQKLDRLKVSALIALAHGFSGIKPFVPKFEEIKKSYLNYY